MIYSLYIQGEKRHSFRTFSEALAFCQYHNIASGSIRIGGVTITTIRNGEAV